MDAEVAQLVYLVMDEIEVATATNKKMVRARTLNGPFKNKKTHDF